MANVEANWTVELNADCPSCEKFVNLLDCGDFWEGKSQLRIAEHATDRSRNVEVVCPECNHEFKVDLTY